MSVRAKYEIDGSALQNMEMTISFTMTVAEWSNLNNALPKTGYEAVNLGSAIRDAMQSVNRASTRIFTYPPQGEPL
jgi:hypothetical protein